MQDLVIKILKAVEEVEDEKGSFMVKCLVARDPDDIIWDLVLSADWFQEDLIQRLKYLSKKILADFDNDNFSQFSAIITISPDSDLAHFLIKLQEGYKQQYQGQLYVGGQDIIQTDNEQAPMVVPLDNILIAEMA